MPARGTVSHRTKASALWGLVGALSFLVLAQAARLLDGPSVGFLPLLGVAIVVALGTTAVTYHAADRLP
ncbi:hypothetical protein [Halobacterium zhouii]|uniref:hypothetical protein n=1 Tax=Halobacterium zhouii TaxID=2902624 RepID=UPI001E35C93C|nr:hypothetical protein [Halobacterium zhouii]